MLKDKDFIRGDVPMTKEEVRMISIGKLDLKKDSVMIDIGAGTGSIGIQGAINITHGKVYGIERNIKGIEIIKKNIEKFKIKNYELIQGIAPESLGKIEKNSFDRMFIGGSGGKLKEILDFFMENSKENSKIVINIIALETLTKTLQLIEETKIKDIEIINVNISRGKKIGNYTMMNGENPIYIVSGRK